MSNCAGAAHQVDAEVVGAEAVRGEELPERVLLRSRARGACSLALALTIALIVAVARARIRVRVRVRGRVGSGSRGRDVSYEALGLIAQHALNEAQQMLLVHQRLRVHVRVHLRDKQMNWNGA